MIAGYVHNEHVEEAPEFFQKIPELSRNPILFYDHRLCKKGHFKEELQLLQNAIDRCEAKNNYFC